MLICLWKIFDTEVLWKVNLLRHIDFSNICKGEFLFWKYSICWKKSLEFHYFNKSILVLFMKNNGKTWKHFLHCNLYIWLLKRYNPDSAWFSWCSLGKHLWHCSNIIKSKIELAGKRQYISIFMRWVMVSLLPTTMYQSN